MLSESKASPTRRARTLAGSQPPTIALDIARFVACVRWAADASDCCTSATAGFYAKTALPLLATRLRSPLADAFIRPFALQVARHISGHQPASRPATSVDDLVSGLRAVFDLAQPAGTLNETVAAAIAAGVDGELVCWEAISRESVRHEGLINKECNRLVRVIPDRGADDLKGYGWAGLRMALRNFDPNLGYAFSTYACPKINGAIRDGARAESHIPKRLTTFVRKVSKAEEKLTQKLGRAPNLEEIASSLDATMDSMRLLPRLAPSASLEELSMSWGDKAHEPACLVSSVDPVDSVLGNLRDEALRSAVEELPEDERVAIQVLMLEEVPIGVAAERLGIEARQLRARKQRGLKSLADALRDWAPDFVAA